MVGDEEITRAAAMAAPKGPRNHFANRNELRTGVQKIRQYMESYQTNPQWYNELFNFFQGVEDFAKGTWSGRENSDPALAEIHKTLENIQNDTKHIREKQSITESPDSAACWRAFRARNRQCGVQNTSAPTSQNTGITTPGAPHTELGVDCELTVKIRDEAMRVDLKKLSPFKIVERAERARESAVKKSNGSPLAASAFIAARQLPSGDVSLRASNAVGAEVLRHHADKWVKTFGMTAHVRVPTWASVAHGVLCQSMDLTQEKMMDVATRLLATNQHTWGKEAKILHVGWLVKPRKGKREGSIVIEFTNPIVANRAIDQGTVWEAQIHGTTVFCREGRSKLCRKCQKPGHVHAQCPNSYTCGTCAGEHPTWECPSVRGKIVEEKCANCKGKHRAVSMSCQIRKAEAEKAKEALRNCEPYHRIPEYFLRKETRKEEGKDITRESQTAGTSEQTRSRVTTVAEPTMPTANGPSNAINRTSSAGPVIVHEQKRGRGRPRTRTFRENNILLPNNTQSTAMALPAPQAPSERSLRRRGNPINMMSDPDRLLHRGVKRPRRDEHHEQVMDMEVEELQEADERDPDSEVAAELIRQLQQAQITAVSLAPAPEDNINDNTTMHEGSNGELYAS